MIICGLQLCNSGEDAIVVFGINEYEKQNNILMMNNSIVKVENLSHRYSKDWAIKDINFEINKHGIVGLLGSNGAGKSTTMNIMCGVINQTQGNVYINGVNIRNNPVEAKRLIGFLPQKAPLYLELTVDEYLTHCAFMRDIEPKNINKAVESAKARCGISHFSKRVIRNLSGGYQQRVGIAQAIIHDPKLVVLDEPTNGLDPNQIREVRKLIREIAEERSVILSTHILPEVQATCNDIIMIEHGKIVFSDTMEAFDNYVNPDSILVTLKEPPVVDELNSIPGVNNVVFLNENTVRLRYDTSKDIVKTIVDTSVAKEWNLREISVEKSSLDEIFAKLSSNNYHKELN